MKELMKNPKKIKDVVAEKGLEVGDWVQVSEWTSGNKKKSEGNGKRRQRGEWGWITQDPEATGDKIQVEWAGGRTGLTECRIMDFYRGDPTKRDKTIEILKIPEAFRVLADRMEKEGDDFEEGDRV